MIKFTTTESKAKATETFLQRAAKQDLRTVLAPYGAQGVAALSGATPVESGETARSWYYEIETKGKWVRLVWKNRHVVNGVPVAIILQYGHATRNGGYVQGQNFIPPAIEPVMDQIATKVWKEVTK